MCKAGLMRWVPVGFGFDEKKLSKVQTLKGVWTFWTWTAVQKSPFWTFGTFLTPQCLFMRSAHNSKRVLLWGYPPMQSKGIAMPLPHIVNGTADRCTAKCKARGSRCLNLAAYGSSVCRYHGAKRKEAIKRGKDHWNYQHGQETLEAKRIRSLTLADLYNLEAISFGLGFASGPKWRGPKPKLLKARSRGYG